MKKIVSKIGRPLFCIVLCTVVILSNALTIKAANIAELPSLVVESYSLTNEKIIPGQTFTLTLKIKNCSRTIQEENILVNISNPPGVMPVYGTFSQKAIVALAPQESKEISFDYKASESLTSEYIDFGVNVSGLRSVGVALRAPIGADNPFSILSVNLPEAVYAGDVTSAGVSFKIIGDENAPNVSIELLLDDVSVSTSSIGTLKPGTTRNHSVSTSISKAGVYAAQIVLYYDDETGQTKSVIAGEGRISVMEKMKDTDELPVVTAEPTRETPNRQDERLLLGIGGLAVLAVLAGVVLLIRRRR